MKYMKYNLKVAKAWTKEDLDKWLEGFEKELREKFIEFGDSLRDDIGLDSLTKTTMINKILRLEKEILGE